jgi:hypothetical protein
VEPCTSPPYAFMAFIGELYVYLTDKILIVTQVSTELDAAIITPCPREQIIRKTGNPWRT